tara:strand:- start:2693 stop:2830 length:138 start_codon:yes stop_codon:yes gene_type:complete
MDNIKWWINDKWTDFKWWFEDLSTKKKAIFCVAIVIIIAGLLING